MLESQFDQSLIYVPRINIMGANKVNNLSNHDTTNKSRSKTAGKEMQDAAKSAMKVLKEIKKISSQSDIDNILVALNHFCATLPTLTIQKMLKIDENHFEKFVYGDYKELLNVLVFKFDHSFPISNGTVYPEVKHVFGVEDHNFFDVSCDVILSHMKEKKADLGDALSFLMESLLKSEACFAFIFSHLFCKRRNVLELEDEEIQWQKLVQRFVAIPNIIANGCQGQITDFFKTNNFCKLFIFNIVKTIEFITDMLQVEKEQEKHLNYSKLSHLLSKILINFHENHQSEGLQLFINIIAILTNQTSNKQHLYRKIICNILQSLEPRAVEILCLILLKNLDLKEFNIKMMLGQSLIKNDNWKYALYTKIPLLFHYEDDNLIKNLIVYLSSTAEHTIVTLLINILTVWSSKSSIQHTSIEQHYYLTKLIVVIMNCMKNIGFSEHERRIVEEKIHVGVPIHLENSSPEIRVMGMKTSEIILNFTSSEKEEDNKLNFSYQDLSAGAKKIAEALGQLHEEDLSIYYKTKDVETDVSVVISKLINFESSNEECVKIERRVLNTQQENPTNVVVAESIHAKNLINVIDSLELDSDDDLEPYDLSNDIKKPKKELPKYLRDLKEAILESDDVDTFSKSLEICEDLIIQQLPDDDVSLGLELLQILVSLDQRFYVQNFEDLIFKSCVAITCVYPAQSAEYLSKEFHAEIGTYSVAHRLFVLSILCEAARTLSTLKPEVEPKKIVKKIKRSPELENAEEVIKHRLEAKTRYFHKHKSFRVEKMNSYSHVVGHFFFPLLYGYNNNKMISQVQPNDNDFTLLVQFIKTLTVVMLSAQNCPLVPRMTKELLPFSWFLRFHKDVKVRMEVITLIGSAVLSTPKALLVSDFLDELIEFRLWLGDLLSLNIARGEPNLECRDIAASVVCLLDGILKVDE